jgi:hypothetical protein
MTSSIGIDRPLAGMLLLAVAFLPCATEVFHQLRLQARFLAALPRPDREALPRHPRRPSLAFLGSTRFQLALWRAFRRDLPGDLPAVAAIKRRMRASLRREIAWMAGFATTLTLLLGSGWRPIW